MRIDDSACDSHFASNASACLAHVERPRSTPAAESVADRECALCEGHAESAIRVGRLDSNCGASACDGTRGVAASVSSADALISESLDAKRRASELLRSLHEQRELLDARLAESGRPDPIRAVSGRSAMERAIASTRALISAADDLLLRQLLAKSPAR